MSILSGVPVGKLKLNRQELEVVWTAVVAVIKGIHSRGVAIMDMKPNHIIISPSVLYIIDYGCSYVVNEGRTINLVLISPIFASELEFSQFANPVC